MMTDSQIDLDIWTEAQSNSNWLRNHIQSNRIKFGIPFTAWLDSKPDFYFLVSFGEKGYAFKYSPSTVGRKLSYHALSMHFLSEEKGTTPSIHLLSI